MMEVTLNDYRELMRFRREMSMEEREAACDGLEYGSAIAEAVADVAGDINSIPVIGKVAGVITGCVAAVGHVTKAGMAIAATALKCDDIPFDEIKEIMDKRFNELERRLDENAEAMKKVTEMVEKTLHEVEKVRADMNKGFNKIMEEVQFLSTKESITQIHNIIDYFNSEKKRIGSLSKDEYVTKLEERDGILNEMKNSRTTKKDTLNTAMHEIVFNGSAIPKNAEDANAFKALYALYYAAQSYVAIFGFLLESHSYLADYYYQKGNYKVFNEQVDKIKSTFNDFKFSLLQPKYGHLIKIKSIIETVKGKPFFNNIENDLFKELSDREKQLKTLISRIEKMELPVIKDIPPTAILQFKKPVYQTPLGDWKSGISVRYAVQFEKDGTYSKLSAWSNKLPITNKACPVVKVPVDNEGRNRLVFRQIDNDTPQLVGILANPKTEFRDINRDLYNAAGAVDMDFATENVRKLIQHGADVNAVFELGRTAMHKAAETGNKEVMNILLENDFNDINFEDYKGYTPLHVAADRGVEDFIPEMISKGANPDSRTKENLYTPLHLASKNGFGPAVADLVARTQNIEVKDKDGYMPLHYAVSGGSEVIDNFFKFSQARTVNVNAESDTGMTPLHLAAIKGVLDSITALKQSRSPLQTRSTNAVNLDPNVGDSNGMTPLHFAAMLENIPVIEELLKIEGIDINAKAEHNQWTPLHYAIYFKKVKAIKLLASHEKININAKAAGGCTPLHFAAMTDQFHMVIEMLVHGAKLEETTDEGYTALHLGAMLEEAYVAAMLVQNRANVNAKSKADETPLDIAVKFGSVRVQEMLTTGPQSRRDINPRNIQQHKVKTNDPSKFKVSSEKEAYVLNGVHQDAASMQSLKLMDSNNSFKRSQISSIQNIDPIGTLLLLDLILRKITKESHVPFSNGFLSNYEANARALEITEKFEDTLSSLSDLPPAEQIDLSEIYTKVKRALLSGNERKIANILCSYAEKVSSVDSKYFDKLKVAYEEYNSRNLHAEVAVEIMDLLENTCRKQNVK